MATSATDPVLGSATHGTTDNAIAGTAAASLLLLPRVTIKFCTQCKWMLRAAYYAQELLSTFSTTLGEVALQPSTGGVFLVQIQTATSTIAATENDKPAHIGGYHTLWDRKVDGGFPETKELKRRVRDVVEPGRNLGHVDRDYARLGSAARITAVSHAAELASDRAPESIEKHLVKSGPDHAAAISRTEVFMAGHGNKTCEDCS